MGYEYKLPKLISCSIFTVRNCAFCFASARCPSMREKCIFLRNKKKIRFGTAAQQKTLVCIFLIILWIQFQQQWSEICTCKEKENYKRNKDEYTPPADDARILCVCRLLDSSKTGKKVKCWELPNTKLFESHTQNTARICIPSNENLFDQTYDLVLVHIFLSLPHSLAGHNTFFHRFYVRV